MGEASQNVSCIDTMGGGKMRRKDLSCITISDLEKLIKDEVTENKYVEYKLKVHLKGEGRINFLSEICAFANSNGGDLIIGIKENSSTGAAQSIEGIPVKNIDQYKLQLQNIIRSNVQPSIDLEMKEIKVNTSTYVLIIRVKEGNNKPYMINLRNGFYYRDVAGKRPMSFSEIRNSFVSAHEVKRKMISFIKRRIREVGENKSPIGDFKANPKVIMHILPIKSFKGERYNIFELNEEAIFKRLLLLHHEILQPCKRWLSDGFVLYGNPDNVQSYVKVYESGVIEVVSKILWDNSPYNLEKCLLTFKNEKEIIKCLGDSYLPFLKEMGVDLPYVLFISILNAKGFYLDIDSLDFLEDKKIKHYAFSNNVVHLKSVIVDSFDEDPAKILKPSFYSLWRHCGINRDFHYNQEGNWRDN